jgi:hypothetical protein
MSVLIYEKVTEPTLKDSRVQQNWFGCASTCLLHQLLSGENGDNSGKLRKLSHMTAAGDQFCNTRCAGRGLPAVTTRCTVRSPDFPRLEQYGSDIVWVHSLGQHG